MFFFIGEVGQKIQKPLGTLDSSRSPATYNIYLDLYLDHYNSLSSALLSFILSIWLGQLTVVLHRPMSFRAILAIIAPL
jgi:hypothetical protein